MEYSESVRRAALPEVLLDEDVAAVFQCSRRTARRLMRAGECGPFVQVGSRLAVLREVLLSTLAQRSRAAPAEREVRVLVGPGEDPAQ